LASRAGYEINYLREQISRILHMDRDWSFVLVGFGDLGKAIAHPRVVLPAKAFILMPFLTLIQTNRPKANKNSQDIKDLAEIIQNGKSDGDCGRTCFSGGR
jgi:NADH/NAD ratio-sensing transcriptional regulator Rex